MKRRLDETDGERVMRSPSSFAAVAIAITVVAAVAIVIASFWRQLGASEISAAGWLAMGLGLFLTFGLGVGLMALMFISHRGGYDDPEGRDR